ncbi:MAG: hypothetical protein HZA12_07275 [Nitrospirae bacterium]|nr:hypothetical protein [Nitrospirota bacterium]
MRNSRYRLIAAGILTALIVAVWFFKPLPPSVLKERLYGQAYLASAIKIRSIWDKPFASIIASVPGGLDYIPAIPFFLRPLLPPVAEVYLLSSKGEGGWAIAADLGWRSRLFKTMHGLIMDQLQYRGVGALEGEYTLRTPSGRRLLLYQDGGTLFVAEGDALIRRIIEAGSDISYTQGSPYLQERSLTFDDKKVILYLSFTNKEGDVERAVAILERGIGFLLLPSAGGISDGAVNVRSAGENTLIAEMSVTAGEGGDIDGIEGDIGYLSDLLERFLSAQNMKTEKGITKEDGRITAQIMIHH